jgi:predicted O-methyltransferase YrrM
MFSPEEYRAAEGIAFTTTEEQKLLTRIASTHAESNGVILDGGAFLGASTVSLARGLNERCTSKKRRIISIDHFTVQDEYVHAKLHQSGINVSYGDSILELYLHNTRSVRQHIETRAGEATRVGRIQEIVDIAFIDISKTPALNSFISLEWFRRMIPGHSVVIQQDFHSPVFPWIPASMGVAAEYFSVAVPKVGETAVFRLEKPLPSSVLSKMAAVSALSMDGLRQVQRIAALFPPEEQHTLELIQCNILAHIGRATDARDKLETIIAGGSRSDAKWHQWTGKIRSVIDAADRGLVSPAGRRFF